MPYGFTHFACRRVLVPVFGLLVCSSVAAAPVLDIGGLGDLNDRDAAALAGDSSPLHPASAAALNADAFAGRVDKNVTLSERAAAILDRTTIGGYGEHEFLWGEGETAHFRNHRYVIFVYSQISKRISTATEIEFEFAGSPLKRDGSLVPGEVLLEFSVVDFEINPAFVLRAGVVLMPVGTFNLRHDSPTRDLGPRPIAYTTIVPTTWFESGVGLLGKLDLGDGHRLTYEAYTVNGLDARIIDGFGLRPARGSHHEDNNNDQAVTGRLAWSPALGYELGFSGYSGEYNQRGGRVVLGNLDFMARNGPLEVIGEAVIANIDPGFVEGFAPSSPSNSRARVPEGMFGFYAQLNYHFRVSPLWRLLPPDLEDSVLTAVLRYGGKDTDTGNFSADGDARRLTLGLNYRPIEAFVWKFDFQWNSHGVDAKRGAREFWQSGFWDHRKGGALPDRLAFSVAYLF